MRESLIDKLDMLAADEETDALDSLKRNTAALGKARGQQQVLSAYRDRLSTSFQGGVVLDAALVKNANHYIAATWKAEEQIAANALRIEGNIDRDMDTLASVRIERKNLHSARKKVEMHSARVLERRAELLTPPRLKRP
jgi:hypothetical protein